MRSKKEVMYSVFGRLCLRLGDLDLDLDRDLDPNRYLPPSAHT